MAEETRLQRGVLRLWFGLELPVSRRTRLEGSTWYELSIEPRAYWRLWTDGIIHQIHDRVLSHIRRRSEHGS